MIDKCRLCSQPVAENGLRARHAAELAHLKERARARLSVIADELQGASSEDEYEYVLRSVKGKMIKANRKCPECDCPMLPKGKRRQHPDDYRHARGCPKASAAERRQTERLWQDLDREVLAKGDEYNESSR